MKRFSLLLALVTFVGCASSGGQGPEAGGPAPSARADSAEAARALTPAQEAALRVDTIEVRPDRIRARVGEEVGVEAVPRDSAGAAVEGAQLLEVVQGGAATWEGSSGAVRAVRPGEATFYAVIRRPDRGDEERRAVVTRVPIVVDPLPVERVEVRDPEGPVYAGTRVRLAVRAYSAQREREEFAVSWESSSPEVARVSEHGLVQAGGPGTATVTATSEGVAASVQVRVVANPVREVELETPSRSVVTGEVVHLDATPRDAGGEPVEDAPVEWTVDGPGDRMSESAYLDGSGAFVAEEPGLYRVTATVGDRSSTVELSAAARPYRRELEEVGHGKVAGHASSDLWVFQGVDGRDYAYTGTHAAGAGGNVMYAWDVTDRAEPAITDSVVVDARVVNDVKINETRQLAVITREGASDRRNGIVLLDIRVPAHPKVIAGYTENLTAGVHNVWIEDGLVYAVNDGTRALHVIDVSNPRKPRQVGRWQLDFEDRYLHDVIVQDGLAYLSYWDHGLVILDVGRGIAGGTPTEPEMVSRFEYRSRWGAQTHGNTHHAIPYGDYVFVGDEIFGCSECVNGPRGYVHVIDVSDLEDPKEVAWFRVPEAGTHNLWVEDDRLYVAYYQGGLRVVDVSGELRGDLYAQGREIGWFMTEAGKDEAFRPNDTMAWGSQPFEGDIFAVDMNSGLWVLDFEEEGDEETGGGQGDGG